MGETHTDGIDNGTSTGNYPSQGDPHPIGMSTLSKYIANGPAWYIESPTSAEPLMEGAPKAGRSFYTSLGHLDSSTSLSPPHYEGAEE
jgi:hypothetical protein